MEKPITTILLVEDDPIHAQLIENAINCLGESVLIEVLSSANECLESLEKGTEYNMIILNYDLPEKTGFQLLKAIRIKYQLKQPVIMLLSHRNENMADELLKEGATQCTIKTKDYTSHLLISLKEYMKRHPLAEENVILEYRPQEELIRFTMDEKEMTGKKGETVLEVAKRYRINIPTLCYHPSVTPAGMCRLCIVEVSKGGRSRLVISCMYPVDEGIVVKTATEKVMKYRRMILELLMARCPDSEIIRGMAKEMGLEKSRFSLRQDPDKCILCGLCIRVCDEIIGAHALCFSERGIHRKVDTPFLELSETCTGCGECAKICPTNAITLEYIDTHIMKKRKARIAIKCDGCVGYKNRACVTNCPTGALSVMSMEDFLAKNKGSINIELRELLKYSLGEAGDKNAGK